MENAACTTSGDSVGGNSVAGDTGCAPILAHKEVASREEKAGIVGALAEGMSLAQLQEYPRCMVTCMSRYNVEKVKFHNFYDLVVLEVPGNSGTGLVWKRKFGQDTTSTHTLAPHQLVQLSLDGALLNGGSADASNEGNCELLSLEELVIEKQMSENVRKLGYFRLYREARMFLRWKTYTKQSKMDKNRNFCATQYFQPCSVTQQKIRKPDS